jgi:hypothetical protein
MSRLLLLLATLSFWPSLFALPQVRPRHTAPTTPPLLERWRRMSPAERRRLLERMPPERRAPLASRLDRLSRLDTEERERLIQQYQLFRQLPPEKQEAVRRLFRRFQLLPEDRRSALRDEIQRLSQLTLPERLDRLASDGLRSAYSEEERRILERLARLLPEPN